MKYLKLAIFVHRQKVSDVETLYCCNGAGKTIASYTVLPEVLGCKEFVNVDEIAQELLPVNPEGVAIETGWLINPSCRSTLCGGNISSFGRYLVWGVHLFQPFKGDLGQPQFERFGFVWHNGLNKTKNCSISTI